MAYHLKAGETIPEGIKRIASEELEAAADLLSRTNPRNRDHAIHEARKNIKKTRAVLKLVRRELDAIYKKENRRLREVGRTLSQYRDAQAMIEIFDSLTRHYKNDLGTRTLGSIRQALQKRKREGERAGGIDRTLKSMAAALHTAATGVKNWPLKKDGFAAIAPGVTETYRQGRQAMEVARKSERPKDCHQWRKRVKDHWYHIRLLESLWTELMASYEKSLKNLETRLGDHHNLEVLHQALKATPDFYGSREDVDLSRDLIAKYQKELLKNALSLGERVYAEKPRQFRKRMKGLWDAWQSQPKNFKKIESRQRKQAAA